MFEKQIVLHNINRKTQFVTVGPQLGRILLRQEVKDIVQGFGSTIKTDMGATNIDIVPPLTKQDQAKFGEKLIDLAISLDPTPPPPTFTIM